MKERRRKADKKVFVAYGLIVASFGIGLKCNSDTAAEADRKIRAAAVERAEQIRAETRARAVEVEESRRDVLIRACRQQNRRHDRTIRELDRLIAELPAGPRRERAREGRAGTVALIEALAPRRDCAKRAERLIRP